MTETQSIRVLDRLFAILDFLAERMDYAGVTEIAGGTGLSTTTAHRILATCEAVRVVTKDENGRYRVGPGSLSWSNSYQVQTGLARIARDHLRELLRDVGETVNLFVYEKGSAFSLEKFNAYDATGFNARVGVRLPLYCTASGRAILAALPDVEFREYLSETDFPKRTEFTTVDRDDFERIIAETRRRGYATERQENEIGMRCVGAAILNRDGYPVGGISVTAPVFRLPDDRVDAVGKRVHGTACLISRELGFDLGRVRIP